MENLLGLVYVLALFGPYIAGTLTLGAPATEGERPAIPWATIALFALVAVPTLLQFALPGLLPTLRRDTAAVLAGQWWRVATSLVVQDGGLSGAIFNLIGLALIGAVGERIWGKGRLALIFLVGGLATNLLALAWQPLGAGNSIANFSVAGSVLAWLAGRLLQPPALAAAILGALVGLPLLALRDIHGAALLIGAALGALLRGLTARDAQRPHR